MKRLDRGSRRSPQGCAAVMKWAQKTSPVPSRAILAHLVMHPPVAIFFLPGAWSGLSPHQVSLSQTPPTLCSLERDPGAHVASVMFPGSALSRHSLEAARARWVCWGERAPRGCSAALGPLWTFVKMRWQQLCELCVSGHKVSSFSSAELCDKGHQPCQRLKTQSLLQCWRERDQRSSLGRNKVTIIVMVALVVKNLPTSAEGLREAGSIPRSGRSPGGGDLREAGSIPRLGRSPGGGNSNPLQYSCLENPMDRGPWRSTAHGVTKSRTRLKQRSIHVTFTKSSNRVTIIFFPRVCSPILTNLILTISF